MKTRDLPERRRELRLAFPPNSPPPPAQWGATAIDVPVRNLSSCGVGLLVGHEAQAGSVQPIRLYSLREKCWHLKLVKGIYVHPPEMDRWAVGCSFLQPLARHELRGMTGEAETERSAVEHEL